MSTPIYFFFDGERMTKYERVYDYAQAYELHAWGLASATAWDILACVAAEYERGDRDWESARERIDKLVEEIHR